MSIFKRGDSAPSGPRPHPTFWALFQMLCDRCALRTPSPSKESPSCRGWSNLVSVSGTQTRPPETLTFSLPGEQVSLPFVATIQAERIGPFRAKIRFVWRIWSKAKVRRPLHH